MKPYQKKKGIEKMNSFLKKTAAFIAAGLMATASLGIESFADSAKLNQLKPVINYIDTNYYKELTLVELAELIDLSPQYLCRLFKDCYAMRPFEYLAKRRIQKAKLMLVQDKYTVNEIAQIVGYNDCSYFCSVFKKHEGISPAEFRAVNCTCDK